MAHPVTWGAPRGQEQKALQGLHQLGVSHILFDKQQLDSLEADTFAIARPSVLASWYDLEYEDKRFVLYRLCWERSGPLGLGKLRDRGIFSVEDLCGSTPEAATRLPL